MERIEVYLCDDVSALRLVVRTVLELEPSITVVGEAGDGEVALQELGRLRPDVLVLDLSLGRTSSTGSSGSRRRGSTRATSPTSS